MRGHEAIKIARMEGYHPKHIWVILIDYKQPDEFNECWDPELLLEKGYQPEIHVFDGDNLVRADLRCLNGLTVHLVGQTPQRLQQAAKQLMRFKPASLYACNGKQFIEHHHSEKV